MDPTNSAADFQTAIAYAQMYGKVMGVDSGFLINQVKIKFKAGQLKDTALLEFDIDPKNHFLYYRNFGYMTTPGQIELGY